MQPNIEAMMTQLLGADPRFTRAMSMMKGKTPAEMQQIVMNMAMTQGVSQNQLAPLIADIKQKFAMFGIQL